MFKPNPRVFLRNKNYYYSSPYKLKNYFYATFVVHNKNMKDFKH